MLEGTRHKFFWRSFCFRPAVEVDGVLDHADGSKRRKHKHQDANISVSQNVANNSSASPSSRPRNRSLSRILKAVMFNSALTRRIRRKKSSKSKSHLTSTTDQSLPSLDRGGLAHGEVKAFEANNPDVVSPSFRSESKCTDYMMDEIVSDYESDMSTLSHGMREERQGIDLVHGQGQKRQPTRKLTTEGFSLLNHRGVHVFLTVLGLTVAWGKAGAILFTSIWLYSVFFQRIARPRRIQT